MGQTGQMDRTDLMEAVQLPVAHSVLVVPGTPLEGVVQTVTLDTTVAIIWAKAEKAEILDMAQMGISRSFTPVTKRTLNQLVFHRQAPEVPGIIRRMALSPERSVRQADFMERAAAGEAVVVAALASPLALERPVERVELVERAQKVL